MKFQSLNEWGHRRTGRGAGSPLQFLVAWFDLEIFADSKL